MSKSEVIYNLKREIKALNRAIDEKIVKRLPYTREARQHKLLRAQLSLIKRKSLLARSMRVVSTLMF